MIQNPILPGFNPDPSIVRVGDDYYIATSTFEWYPGVQIHHSRDLVNWRLLTRPLTRASQLNMLGAPDSCGVWAPCLTYADGLFWLIYTDVKRYGRTSTGGATGSASLRDFHNYLVTSPAIDGPWSDPVYLNSSGFDPSLFHDTDGRKYLLNQLWDHRPGGNRFNGIVAQEYSVAEGRLVGRRTNIFPGTAHGLTEAPHLYQRDGYYYLLTAEGGTGWHHGVTMARSRDLLGPYELHPDVTILTSRQRPDAALQRAGHADLVETRDGQTYMVYLCGRPLRNRGTCTLGRETAIQPMAWGDDGWLRTVDGSGMPALQAPVPALPEHRFAPAPVREDFDGAALPIDFQWLRSPWPDELFSLEARPGHLRLHGRESLGSTFRQALVARRQQSHCFSAATVIDFAPEHYQQQAGLVCYYNAAKFHYLYITHDDTVGRHLRVMSSLPNHVQTDTFTLPVPLPASGPVELRVEVDEERLLFGWRPADDGPDAAWQWLPQQFDASILSDEANAPGQPNFTGAFVGMACQDMSGARLHADFDWFAYRGRAYCADAKALPSPA
ncbi:glycoside hydrolase family 43 protein [Pseudoduganella albidiflava]|uniref:Glycoside hydrolase family 43 protein n=1 Tax=Pseudoduganella albidiflava TaxID=321983 RepID=A0A411WZ92_9BURK|nr:glycoside hydrolase family 43 protein [Pseudoduganella albidiflava]QBI02047.1 glycoside hydrolase family 43 protein [Pseudoduganella albidiflava]GGY65125.1 xylan 1,4-beta-xylosidase [Pseudoduganella albidiflava]